MMMVTEFLIFASAFAASSYVFWQTLMPAMPRIVALLTVGVDPVRAERPMLSVSEPRGRARLRTAPTTAAPRQALRAAA